MQNGRRAKLAYTVTLTEGLEPASYTKPVISEGINHQKKSMFSVSCHSKPAPPVHVLPN